MHLFGECGSTVGCGECNPLGKIETGKIAESCTCGYEEENGHSPACPCYEPEPYPMDEEMVERLRRIPELGLFKGKDIKMLTREEMLEFAKWAVAELERLRREKETEK